MNEQKAIELGHPSYVWGFGQERRLGLIRRYAPLEGARTLDVGCGLGLYVHQFRRFTDRAFGVEVDLERAVEARRPRWGSAGTPPPGIVQASGERLPFPDDAFDVVLLHEVIEHMDNDRAAIAEAVRVLRPGGRVVVFAPNRRYPFETHGFYWRGQYHFGNIPGINYLPDNLRRRLAPHVRAYTGADIRRLFAGLPVVFVIHTQIYPGYDKIAARHPALGRALRQATYLLENTPLRAFGLSHLVVAEKVRSPRPDRSQDRSLLNRGTWACPGRELPSADTVPRHTAPARPPA